MVVAPTREPFDMRVYLSALLASLALSGCLAEVVTTTAITGTLQAEQMGAMKRQIGHAAESTGKTNLQRAISTYQAEKGSLPPSLEALVPAFVPALPAHTDGRPYGYDPATGNLYDSPEQAAQAIDQRTIQQVLAAINQYGTSVGYYPPTLDALAPTYLPAPPRTTNGMEFYYDNQNGQVTLPYTPARPGNGSNAAPVGGAGPLGEAMTGIAIQNELGNSSNAGANAAGSRLRNATPTGDQRTTNALDNLGL